MTDTVEQMPIEMKLLVDRHEAAALCSMNTKNFITAVRCQFIPGPSIGNVDKQDARWSVRQLSDWFSRPRPKPGQPRRRR
ncbi:MAG: hypothetical protein GY701_28840 [Sulfitobacter sp.]|nr:hypothetical protein [Sulfitobacter sp.]